MIAWIVIGIASAIWLLGMLANLLVQPAQSGMAFGLAVIPLAIVAAAFLWIDRAEPEPRRYLFAAFVWGGTIAVALSLLIQLPIGAVMSFGPLGTLVAPVSEEAAKGLFLLLLLWWRRREFDGIVDGIVYAGFVAAGFAFSENILYITAGYIGGDQGGAGIDFGPGGVQGALMTFVMRGVISPFAHPLFTVMTGIGLAIFVVSARRIVRVLAPIGGLLAAIALHALWNFSAFSGYLPIVYFVFFVPLFAVMVGYVTVARRKDLHLLELHLPAYVHAGWLHGWELPALSSFKGRRRARRWAAGVHGKHGKRAMAGLQRTATELAFLRRKAAHHRPIADFAAREYELLTALVGHKHALASATA